MNMSCSERVRSSFRLWFCISTMIGVIVFKVFVSCLSWGLKLDVVFITYKTVSDSLEMGSEKGSTAICWGFWI
ncbi:hypothetical protein Hanom_Chr02g00142541 [Helianthus anomalus]